MKYSSAESIDSAGDKNTEERKYIMKNKRIKDTDEIALDEEQFNNSEIVASEKGNGHGWDTKNDDENFDNDDDMTIEEIDLGNGEIDDRDFPDEDDSDNDEDLWGQIYSIITLTSGLLSCLLCGNLIFTFLGFVFALVGIVFAIITKTKKHRSPFLKVGVSCSIVGIALSVVLTLLLTILVLAAIVVFLILSVVICIVFGLVILVCILSPIASLISGFFGEILYGLLSGAFIML